MPEPHPPTPILPDRRTLLPEVSAFLARQDRVEKSPIPTLQDLSPDLRDVANTLIPLTGHWNPVEIYTADPDVLAREQDRFLDAYDNGEAVEPELTYGYAERFDLGDSEHVLSDLLHRVRTYRPRDRTDKIAQLCLLHKVKDDLATVDIVQGIRSKNDARTARGLQQKYPGTDAWVLRMAIQDFRQLMREEKHPVKRPAKLTDEEIERLRTMRFNAEDFQDAFEWALAKYGILRQKDSDPGFQVIVDERATAMDVRDKSILGPTVFIPSDTTGSAETLLRLMVHEIEGHARQSANGSALFLLGGGPLKIDDETLYEGLAMRHEDDFRRDWFGTEDTSPLADLYTLACAAAESGRTFSQIFAEQVDLTLHLRLIIPTSEKLPERRTIDPKQIEKAKIIAWRTTYRVMRGHTDMRNPDRFAMAKDLAYLRGWLLDKQLVENGHGHINEASISSVGMLRILSEFQLHEGDLPYPYKAVTEEFTGMLLRGEWPMDKKKI